MAFQTPPPLPKRSSPSRSESADRGASESRISVSVASAISAVVLLFLLAIFLSALAYSRSRGSSFGSSAAAVGLQEGVQLGAENADKDGSDSQENPPADSGGKPKSDEGRQNSPPESSVAATSNSNEETASTEIEEVDRPTYSSQGFTVFPKYKGISNSEGGGHLETGSGNPFLSARDASSVVFVVDKSSSMAGNPLDRVVAALTEALDYLDANQKFMVLFFDGVMHKHPDSSGLVAASPKNVRDYKEWITLTALGGGNTQPWDAMCFALEQEPERVLILSDGEFNPLDVERLTAKNQGAKQPSRIDTIGLSENVQTLRDLAKRNEGIYYQAR